MNEIALFLADRSNGRAYATVLRLSVAVVCTQCIVAKWRVLEQKLILTVVYENSIGTSGYIMQLVSKSMTLTFVYRSNQGYVNCVTFDVEYLGNRYR